MLFLDHSFLGKNFWEHFVQRQINKSEPGNEQEQADDRREKDKI
jgi:hypothetical protein